ncbi:MAG: cytoplasmic protein [Candidatus Methanoperedens nitroreducens]|uniref:Cytoplasmic protein n=1 Tax=Candidatus Methanoperedens nitratireducens TaxID=1392998 RepID=A0A0P8AA07_9EURY|nr:DUF58 domain-containing protein [Candidatus Methanoperedens sp. BLZ2]KAB2948074.1 MAG: DUF58 domain-containing protein [Candidatus Methanoperedens sp.]KPQ43467.1 MAG: cytoplasmic protein [Candidatus Methanoperedens sp. BLZ1]MBZ0173876.1 DUF58 domain-containing protein [Candidatus Methanoperedens nitroreducens]CAG0989804.1 hypothetical protein METP2_02506 [Methanosarcinales archaeon]MCX9080144.1 DUF58 domain-containing protein [Candidatus Methanoperedens sp.]
MIDTSFFKELDRFSFMVRKRVSTAYSGSRRSILKGRGMEPVSYREYTQGDDFKTIDWKVYGRTEKLYVKEFEEEKSLTTHILLDTSKSMDFRNKFEYAAMMALGFAYLVTKDNEKFAVATFGEEINITKPKRGRKYLSLTIDLLNSTQLLGKTRFDYCMEKYASVIRSRSLVFIISDFMADIEAIRNSIFRLGDNELVLIQVLDPLEKNLDLGGEAKLIDLETDAKMDIYTSPRLRAEYQKRLNDHIAKIKETCISVGADFHTVTTDKPIFDSIFEVVNSREAGHK